MTDLEYLRISAERAKALAAMPRIPTHEQLWFRLLADMAKVCGREEPR